MRQLLVELVEPVHVGPHGLASKASHLFPSSEIVVLAVDELLVGRGFQPLEHSFNSLGFERRELHELQLALCCACQAFDEEERSVSIRHPAGSPFCPQAYPPGVAVESSDFLGFRRVAGRHWWCTALPSHAGGRAAPGVPGFGASAQAEGAWCPQPCTVARPSATGSSRGLVCPPSRPGWC